jgi:tripartite-type tricarboxylate transporter receptor subunit TctC
MTRSKIAGFCLSLTVFAAFATAAQAQSAAAYPNKPIRLIVPAAPGGSLDLIGRSVGQKLSEGLRQPVVVENKPGAAFVIGTDQVAKAAPDGYTLLLTSTPHGMNPALKSNLPYDTVRDFTPISLIATIPQILVVEANLPVNSLQEFIKLAKSRPMSYGSVGSGSPNHLSAEMLKDMAGIDLTHIPYKGTGPALTDLIAGRIQFMSVDMTSAAPYLKSGRIRALAIATGQRIPGVELPTTAEAGLPGLEVMSWYAMFAPAGLPESITTRVNAEVVKGLAHQELRERFASLGANVVGSSSEELGRHVQAEIGRWTKAVKAAKIKVD